jgi:hypothetical protein
MTNEDKKRLYRKTKLTIYDLEKLLNFTKDKKTFYFKAGNEAEVNYLQSLENKLKLAIEKESA